MKFIVLASLWLMTLALPAAAADTRNPADRAVAPSPPSIAEAPGGAAADKREIRAQLMPRRYTTLAAEIGAKVNRIAVPEGGNFRSGETLVSFDCSIQQAQLNKAHAILAAADKAWNANKRLNELNAVGKVELEVSEAEVLKGKAEVATNASLLSKCTIAAPFAGRIAEQKVREQQFVQPGQPLLDILDDSVLELEILVPSKWLIWLKPGYRFQVMIDETNKSYPARVLRIGARIDPVSQLIKVSAAIDGKFDELIAGMSGKVTFSLPANQ